MNIYNSRKKFGLVYNTLTGPWPCDQCGMMTQFAEIKHGRNKIFCKNELCRYTRTVDTFNRRIVENDGTQWQYDGGKKWQVRPR